MCKYALSGEQSHGLYVSIQQKHKVLIMTIPTIPVLGTRYSKIVWFVPKTGLTAGRPKGVKETRRSENVSAKACSASLCRNAFAGFYYCRSIPGVGLVKR